MGSREEYIQWTWMDIFCGTWPGSLIRMFRNSTGLGSGGLWCFELLRYDRESMTDLMSTTKTLMTVDEFAQMTTSETEDYELVDGELVPLPSASPLHAKIRQNVERQVAVYFDQKPVGVVLGEVDCRITDEIVRRPDVAIFLASRLKDIDWKRVPLPFAPDIAVEVLSPSETVVEVHRKALEYLAGGSQEVWQLDHENGEVFVQTDSGIRLLRGDAVLETPLLPGFSVRVDKLLAGF
jgi:Uma2 family endonuclease